MASPAPCDLVFNIELGDDAARSSGVGAPEQHPLSALEPTNRPDHCLGEATAAPDACAAPALDSLQAQVMAALARISPCAADTHGAGHQALPQDAAAPPSSGPSTAPPASSSSSSAAAAAAPAAAAPPSASALAAELSAQGFRTALAVPNAPCIGAGGTGTVCRAASDSPCFWCTKQPYVVVCAAGRAPAPACSAAPGQAGPAAAAAAPSACSSASASAAARCSASPGPSPFSHPCAQHGSPSSCAPHSWAAGAEGSAAAAPSLRARAASDSGLDANEAQDGAWGGWGGWMGAGHGAAGCEGEVVIVEPQLRLLFSAAPATKEYAALVEALPEVWVGPRSELMELGGLLCSQMALNFRLQGLDVPPWRRRGVVMARWERRHAVLTPVGPPPSAASPDALLPAAGARSCPPSAEGVGAPARARRGPGQPRARPHACNGAHHDAGCMHGGCRAACGAGGAGAMPPAAALTHGSVAPALPPPARGPATPAKVVVGFKLSIGAAAGGDCEGRVRNGVSLRQLGAGQVCGRQLGADWGRPAAHAG